MIYKNARVKRAFCSIISNMVTGEKRQQLSWFLTLVIVAIVSFVAGARSDALFASVASVFGVRTSNKTIDLSSVQKTYQELVANNEGKLDTQKIN